jgi:hypothetical protein
MDMIFDYIMILFFPLIVIIGVTIFLIKAPRKVKLIRPLRSQKVLFGFLILLTLFGFFTQQDFTERCGCLIHSRGVFSLDYVIFSAISLILFVLGFIVKNKIARISLICLELAYWIFKLFVLKSGYQGGLGILIFKYYDFFGLLGRLLLLNNLFDNKFKEHLLAILAGLLIIIKMLGIPFNDNFIYRDYLNPYYNQLMFRRLNGNWTGTMVYPKDTTVYKPFDSTDINDLISLNDTVTYRDSTILIKKKGVYFYFQDSNLSINRTLPELDGNYSLYYSQPDSRYFIYIPDKYLDSIKQDYEYGRYTIKMHLEELNDSSLSLQIENGIDFELKTAGNNVYTK